MPAVNREPLTPMQSTELEAAHPALPVGRVASPPARLEVEQFNPSTASPSQQQGSAVGSIAASSVGRLDANAVVGQVKELMSGWRVSDDDCKHAVGLLQSLPPAEYAKALRALAQSGDLRTLCEAMPRHLRRDLAESAVHGGVTTTSPEQVARGLREPQPPPQPAMIVNTPSLPRELREVIHGENLVRARQYEADFHAYADAWCAKVAACKSPLALRELGPMSNPPGLLEPGISSDDFAAKRFVSLHCQTNIGVERAAKAVSDQVSTFRKELTAGGFGLDFEVKTQVTSKAEGPSHTEGAAGGAFIAKGTLTQDGRLINQHVESETVLEAGRGHARVEGKFNSDGHLEAVAGEVGGFGVELERRGEVTFKAPVAPGLAVETFVDNNKATSGAALVADVNAEVLGASFKLQGKIGFTAKGVERNYYADLGRTRTGFFGPMPELEERRPWRELPGERREWYARQGFNERSWP